MHARWCKINPTEIRELATLVNFQGSWRLEAYQSILAYQNILVVKDKPLPLVSPPRKEEVQCFIDLFWILKITYSSFGYAALTNLSEKSKVCQF